MIGGAAVAGAAGGAGFCQVTEYLSQ
jgi:hypothetical protein